MSVEVSEDNFGHFFNDKGIKQIVWRITLQNNKIKVQIINFGAIISSLQIFTHNKFDDIVLGYDNISSYVDDTYYLGCTIGRFANRIAKGKFSLEGKEYSLSINNGSNHLHGGIKGFNKVIWDYHVDEDNKVTFFYTSPAMEENYPGELKCSVTFELIDNEVILNYYATTSEKTPVNLTNHSYFNLGGHDFGTVHDHLISINADHYTPVDENCIPTGAILPVDSTPFDLRKPKIISSILSEIEGGVDHNFCINQSFERKVARVEHSVSGRSMEIFSTQPGVQFYTANFLPQDDSLVGKNGICYKKHGGFCLETQNYPDAVNHTNFPKSVLDIGQEYKHTTRFCFSDCIH